MKGQNSKKEGKNEQEKWSIMSVGVAENKERIE